MSSYMKIALAKELEVVKNLRIGAKIMLGFGIVIAMVVVIALAVTISNNSITDATHEVDVYNHINDIAIETYNSFYSSRIYATRFNVQYSAETWDLFAAAFSTTGESGRDGLSYIESDPVVSGYHASWSQTLGVLDEYYTSMDNVRKAYLDAEAAKNALIGIGPEIVSAVSVMYEAQAEDTRVRINAGESASDLNIKIDRINDTIEINYLVTIMRINVSRTLENYSSENVAEIRNSIDAVRDRIEEYMGILRTEASRSIAQNALDKLDAYEETVNTFIDVQEAVAFEKTNAERLGGATLNNLSEKSAAFQENLAAAISSAESASRTAELIVLIIAGVAVVMSVCIALYIKNTITKPVLFINDIAARIAEKGELEFSAAEADTQRKLSEGKDETARTVANFSKLIDRLKKVDECLTSIAENDLSVHFQPLGQQDKMGIALQSMLVNLNKMFGEINSSSGQVSSGSKQVSNGAQALAQGATEQASSIEELSGSISDIAEKTKTNAKMATQAASLAFTIKTNAEKGSRQMDEMMMAVGDINDASQNISRVIKTIDDIAFQTNILALNAAVEAARAGQHGKGFAVVAEEVRNLAAKSAEAAKDTGGLIENSIEKANLGVRIAGETAESLSDIVTGINESDRIVSEIAKSSDEQTIAIENLNVGIDQVAQVVQQNSATAEESAAASEEMSGQSDFLQQLISQFKLANSTETFRHSLPPSASSAPEKHGIPETHNPPFTAETEDFGKY